MKRVGRRSAPLSGQRNGRVALPTSSGLRNAWLAPDVLGLLLTGVAIYD
jgi:hypothetical protein